MVMGDPVRERAGYHTFMRTGRAGGVGKGRPNGSTDGVQLRDQSRRQYDRKPTVWWPGLSPSHNGGVDRDWAATATGIAAQRISGPQSHELMAYLVVE